MAARPLSDESAIEALDLVQEHGTLSAAARAIGMSRETLQSRYNVAVRRGLNLSPGVRETIRRANLNPTEARGGWKHIYDDEGKKIEAVRWAAGEVSAEDMLDKIREAFDDVPTAPYIAKPEVVRERSVAFLPHADWHLGSVVTSDHVGRDYNRKIAVERLKDGFSQCMGAIPASEVAIILNAGDLTHTNSDRDETDRSKHKLKVEGTHHDNIRLAIESTIWMIDRARETHGEVIYTARPGNHDGLTPTFLTPALEQRYRDDPRVTIETDQRETWIWQRDRLFLSAHHGHGLKVEKFCANIPARFPRQFGVSDHWYFFTGHLHHRTENTYGGITHRQLPPVCSIDAHGDGMGYADRPGMSAMRFDTVEGLRSEYIVNL